VVSALQSIQSNSNFKDETNALTYRALNSLTRDDGAPAIDYDRFAALWDAEEGKPPEQQIIRNLVKSFDGNGVVIKTHEKENEQPKGEPKTSRIQAMAKRASAKELG